MTGPIAVLLLVGLLAGCAGRPAGGPAATGTAAAPSELGAYKIAVAQRISQASAAHVHTARPQALLRSIVVLKFSVDADGNLMQSEVRRSNRDRAAEAIALRSLRGAAPFPKPAASLLRRGRLDMSESWLFNNDGRFQLRSIAQPQLGE